MIRELSPGLIKKVCWYWWKDCLKGRSENLDRMNSIREFEPKLIRKEDFLDTVDGGLLGMCLTSQSKSFRRLQTRDGLQMV